MFPILGGTRHGLGGSFQWNTHRFSVLRSSVVSATQGVAMAPTNAGNDLAHTSSQRPAVGRTPWDAIIEVSKTLGNLVPILIVAAGIVFAFFKFQDLSQARDRAVREATEKAREALQKTYDQMVDLSGKQIHNVQALLGLHDEVSKSVKKFQADANQEMEKATQAQREADQAKQEAERAQKEVFKAEKELESKSKALSTAQQNIDRLQTLLI
jgi:methyl-accepting chemotaxis protein